MACNLDSLVAAARFYDGMGQKQREEVALTLLCAIFENGGGGGGGGAVTIADGADVALGSTSDASETNPGLAATVISLLKGQLTQFNARIPALGAALIAASVPVNIASNQTVPVSAASLPLPAGAATEATLSAASAKLPAALVGGRLDVNVGASATLTTTNTPTENNGKTVNRYVLSQVGTPGTATIAAADGTKAHKIVGVMLTLSANGTVKFTAAGADITGAMDTAQYGGFVMPPSVSFPWIKTAVNEALAIVTTGGGANGVILYVTE